MAQALAAFLKEQYGLAISAREMAKIERFVTVQVTDFQVETSKGMLEALRLDSNKLQKLISCITVPETYFFRFPEQFQYLQSKLDEWSLGVQATEARLRVWSAGCATGEEPYSLAIMLARRGLLHQADILASDISEQSLRKAKRACYSKWSLRDQGHSLAVDYLVETSKGFQITPNIRRSVRFLAHNLADFSLNDSLATFGNMDIILCRNVLMYLNTESVRRVLQRLISCLAPGGLLITAPADPIPNGLPVHYLHLDRVGLVLQRPGVAEYHGHGSGDWGGNAHSMGEEEPAERLRSQAMATIVQAEAAPTTPHKPCLTSARESDSDILSLHHHQGGDEASLLEQGLLDRRSEDIKMRYTYVTLLMARKQYDEARDEIRRLNYLNPNLAEVHFTTGAILMRLRDYRGAQRAFARSRSIVERLPANQRLLLVSTAEAGQLLGAIEHEQTKLQVLRMQEI